MRKDTIEKDTNHTTCNTKVELVAKIKMLFKDLSKDIMRNAYARFRSHHEMLVETM